MHPSDITLNQIKRADWLPTRDDYNIWVQLSNLPTISRGLPVGPTADIIVASVSSTFPKHFRDRIRDRLRMRMNNVYSLRDEQGLDIKGQWWLIENKAITLSGVEIFTFNTLLGIEVRHWLTNEILYKLNRSA